MFWVWFWVSAVSSSRLFAHKHTAFTKSAPVFIIFVFCISCNIPNLSTASQSITDKKIEEVIPAVRRFYFPMAACDLIAINFLWFGNNCHFPPNISIISQQNYVIFQFNMCYTRLFLETVSLQLFYWSKLFNSIIRLQEPLYHLIVNFVAILLTVNYLLWCH